MEHAPSEKFWISDLLRSFLVQSESNHDRYSLGICINMDGAAVSASVRDVRENDGARSAIATHTRAAEKGVSTETKETP